jgi:hypothetical protein
MGQRIRSGLTFSNVVALLALFIALGGSVYAASKIDGKTIKKGTIPANRVKADSLGGKQINESKLGEVPSAATAGSAQPVAFAQIGAAGTVNANLSKGVTGANVTHPATGTYCVSGLAFDVKGGQISLQFGGSRGTTAQFTPGSTGNCPDGGQVLLSDNANNAADLTFQIVLYG